MHVPVNVPLSDPWAPPPMPGGLLGMSLSIEAAPRPDPRDGAFVPTHPRASEPGIDALPRPGAKHARRTATALATGHASGPATPMQSGSNKSSMRLQELAHPSLPRVSTTAVIKPIDAGGAQEVFAARVADVISASHLLAGTERRSDASAAIEFVEGTTLQQHGINSAADLDTRLRDALLTRDPAMSVDAATRRAQIDRQLMQVFDVLIGNRDRHPDNALFDAERGVLTLIDHGLIMEAHHPHALSKPYHAYMDDARATVQAVDGQQLVSIPLDPEVVARVRTAQQNFAEIDGAFDTLQRDIAGRADIGNMANPIPAHAIDGLRTRIDDVVKAGALRFLR